MSAHPIRVLLLSAGACLFAAWSPAEEARPPVPSHAGERERGLTGALMRLDPRIRRIRNRLAELDGIDAELPTPMIEPSRSVNQEAALFKLVEARAGSIPFLDFEFPDPVTVDAIYLLPAPLLLHFEDFELRGTPLGTPQRFSVELVTSRGNFTIATRYREPPGRNMPLRLQVGYEAVTRLRIRFPHLLAAPHPAYVSVSEIFILSGARNLAPTARIRLSPELQAEPGWETGYATDERHWLGLPFAEGGSESNGFLSGPVAKDPTPWVELRFDNPRPVDEIRLFPAQFLFHPGKSTYLFPRRLRLEAWTGDSAATAPDWTAEYPEGREVELGSNVFATRPDPALPIRRLRITALECGELDGFRGFALGEVQCYAGSENIAPSADLVVSSQFADPPLWTPGGLTDGKICLGRILPLPQWLSGLDERFKVVAERRYLRRLLERYTIGWRVATAWLWFSLAALTLIGLGGQWLWSRWKRFQADLALRNQMMMDLHDELGGNMGTIAMIADQLRPENDPGDDLEWRERKCATILDIVSTTRQILPRIVWSTKSDRKLLPGEIEGLLHTHLPDLEIRWDASGFRAQFRLPPAIEEALYLIAKEAIQNCAKHSGATRVEGRLTDDDAGIELLLRDNGTWKGPEDATGIGMRSMRTRASQIGAELDIEPSATGTTVRCRIPRAVFAGAAD